jgi:hypothetical protein
MLGGHDLDGDHHDDFVILDTGSGNVFVYSGSDGSRIFLVSGATSTGGSIDWMGDLDGDGVEDLLVGRPSPGRVAVHSGVDGSSLLEVTGTVSNALGRSVAGIGDASGDGVPDLLAGALQGDAGEIRLLSGATGAELYRWTGIPGESTFGISLAGVGDLDRDGLADAVYGVPRGFCINAPGKVVAIAAGNDLHLNIVPDRVQTGDRLSATMREGAPGREVLFAVVAVDEVPFFLNLGITLFDATGTRQSVFDMPPGFEGLTIDTIALARDQHNELIASSIERLEVLP